MEGAPPEASAPTAAAPHNPYLASILERIKRERWPRPGTM
jgi:hypothetical protein